MKILNKKHLVFVRFQMKTWGSSNLLVISEKEN